MKSFSILVQSTCLMVIFMLIVYTLWLMRSKRLDTHVTVRWVLTEITALLLVFLWGQLPFISITSNLGDRELLVVLAVIFFGFIAFLMLDCLSRISSHTIQIRRLAQELAIAQEKLNSQKIVEKRN